MLRGLEERDGGRDYDGREQQGVVYDGEELAASGV